MYQEQIGQLINMNKKLTLILEYAMEFIMDDKKESSDERREKYNLLIKSIDSIVHYDFPQPKRIKEMNKEKEEKNKPLQTIQIGLSQTGIFNITTQRLPRTKTVKKDLNIVAGFKRK